MKRPKILLTVVMIVLLVMMTSGTVMAKPIASVTVGSVTYELNQPIDTIDRVTAYNIAWQNVRPYVITVRLYDPGTDNYVGGGAVGPPKGQEAKYPQNIYCVTQHLAAQFEIGRQFDVRVVLEDRNNNIIADSGTLATITWGTASTWTAP